MPVTKIEDKKIKIVQEKLEELIEELKRDVDEKGAQIAKNKKIQEESFDEMFEKVERVKEEMKHLGQLKFK